MITHMAGGHGTEKIKVSDKNRTDSFPAEYCAKK